MNHLPYIHHFKWDTFCTYSELDVEILGHSGNIYVKKKKKKKKKSVHSQIDGQMVK